MATLPKIMDVGWHPILPPSSQTAIAIENEVIGDELQRPNDDFTEEKVYLKDEVLSEMNFEGIVGKSAALHRALKELEIVAPTDSGVMILGETGTGKELIARAIHNRSSRRHEPFVKVNCAAIPPGLLESELFGHEKGAFTGAVMRKAGRFEVQIKERCSWMKSVTSPSSYSPNCCEFCRNVNLNDSAVRGRNKSMFASSRQPTGT
jgi:hypothetical protein